MKKVINITEAELRTLIKEAINRAYLANPQGNLRHAIAIKSDCYGIDFDEGIAEIGFNYDNMEKINGIIRVLTDMDFPWNGYKVNSVENVTETEDMLPFHPKVIYKIKFSEE